MRKIIIIFCIILPLSALALTPEQIAQQQLVIQQQQEQSRQAEEQRRELREAERIRDTRAASGALDADIAAGAAADGANADCSRFATITVLGNAVYSDARIHKIIDWYIGRCITRDNMAALQNELTALYIDRKYTLARVYFDQRRSKLNKGNSDVVFIIEEGIVNKVEMREVFPNDDPSSQSDAETASATATSAQGGSDAADAPAELSDWQRFRQSTKTLFAVPGVVGDVFNMKDFEQGLDQINRLQSNNATMDIRPTPGLNGAGHSDIIILNNRPSHRTTFFGLGADNGGNKNVGERNLNASINQDNLLALNDNLYIKYTTDTDFDRDHHYSRSIYSVLSIPLGYWTASASVSWSDYKTTVDGLYTSFHTWGDTLTQNYSLDRVLYRSARYRTNLGAALQLRDTENWIRDMKSITGSRLSSNVNIFWNNTIYHRLGTLIIKPQYQRGLGWFGSRKDPSDIYDTEPHLQYDMARLYLYSSMKFDIGIPITWSLTADGQYSFQNLFGVDQQSLGGEWTVRGFRESTISGDDGFYVRNDIRLPVWNLLPDALTDQKFMQSGGGWSINSALSRTQIAVFGDYGYVRNQHRILPDPYDSNSGAMAGAGVGLHYGGKYLNWSLMYARALTAPEYLQTRDAVEKEEQSIYWRFGLSY